LPLIKTPISKTSISNIYRNFVQDSRILVCYTRFTFGMNEPGKGESMTSEAEIRQLNEAYIQAVLISDVAWFQAHLAEDFVCIESDATVLDKPAFLRMTAQRTDLAHYHLDEVATRFYGEVALVRCTGSWQTTQGVVGISRYVDVWVRQGDEWKVVSAQITRPQQQRG
jgi:ketosteroid isomerase-like protein